MTFETGHTKSQGRRGLWRDAINRAVSQRDGDALRELADKLVDTALAGDLAAIKEIGDRLDGRPKQQTEITSGDGESPFKGITVRFVRPGE